MFIPGVCDIITTKTCSCTVWTALTDFAAAWAATARKGQVLRIRPRGGRPRRAAWVQRHQAAAAERDVHDDLVLRALHPPDSSSASQVCIIIIVRP